MFVLNKYNQSINLNFKNVFLLSIFKKNNISCNNVNYIFTYKNKFLRNFIFFYSIFLNTNQFSNYYQKNNPNFKININYNYLLLINENFNNFF